MCTKIYDNNSKEYANEFENNPNTIPLSEAVFPMYNKSCQIYFLFMNKIYFAYEEEK